MKVSPLGPALLLLVALLWVARADAQSNANEAPIPDAKTEIKETIESQVFYLTKQKRYACRYHRITRTHYESGVSTRAIAHEDDVLFLTHAEDDASLVQAGPSPASVPVNLNTFAVWEQPLFQSILAHSVFSRGYRWFTPMGTAILEYTYQPDPKFQPATDIERVANAVEGKVSIDETEHVFTAVMGYATHSVVDGKRLLVLGPGGEWPGQAIPLFQCAAAPDHGIVVPEWWNQASFGTVKRGRNEVSKWLGTLTRTFIDRPSCQEYRAQSRVLPGFTAAPKSGEPQH
jgi:hypothetical protein